MPVQLSLPVSLLGGATFGNFSIEGSTNGEIISQLKLLHQDPEPMPVLLWGEAGSGITHLLHALCQFYPSRGLRAFYVSFNELTRFTSSELLNLPSHFDLICIDDLHLVIGQAHWEESLFHLFNRMRDQKRSLVFGAQQAPQSMKFHLADLASRIRGSMIYRVKNLSDEAKRDVFIEKAAEKGINVSSEVAEYIIHRVTRGMSELTEILEQLDEASLREKRKITIPFVKQILSL